MKLREQDKQPVQWLLVLIMENVIYMENDWLYI